jgi:hypothetical protein
VLIRRTTPEEAALAAPQADDCERCGATADEEDLRLIVLRGRVGAAERTLCEPCAETMLELFLDDV